MSDLRVSAVIQQTDPLFKTSLLIYNIFIRFEKGCFLPAPAAAGVPEKNSCHPSPFDAYKQMSGAKMFPKKEKITYHSTEWIE